MCKVLALRSLEVQATHLVAKEQMARIHHMPNMVVRGRARL